MNQIPTKNEGPPALKRKMNGCLVATLIVVGVAILAVGGCFLVGGAAISGMEKEKKDKLKALDTTKPSDLSPTGELAKIFNLASTHTDLQRENKEKEIKGQVVQWELTVYDVEKSGDDYKVQTKTEINGASQFTGVRENVAAFVTITARNERELAFITDLKEGDNFRFRGYIDGVSMRSLNIEPAILIDPAAAEMKTSAAPETSTHTSSIIPDPTTQPAAGPVVKTSVPSPAALETVTPSDLLPYGNNRNGYGLRAEDEITNASIVGKTVEWTLTVSDIERTPNGYQVTTNQRFEAPARIEIFPRDDNERTKIENLGAGSPISFRGYIAEEEFRGCVVINPAILIQDHPSLGLATQLEALRSPNAEALDLSVLQKLVQPDSIQTTLQQEASARQFKNLKGKIVQGSIEEWETTKLSSGYFFTRSYPDTFISVHINPTTDSELSRLKNRTTQTIPFRGYINWIGPAKIEIGPAIIIEHPAYIAEQNAEAEKHALERKEMRQRDETLRKQEQDKKQREETEEADRKKYYEELGQEQERRRRLEFDSKMAGEEQEAAASKEARTRKGYYVPEAHESQPASSTPAPPPTTTKSMPGERFPQTRLELLGPTELMDLNLADIRYAINEMYARHGAAFQKPELAKVFAAKTWYKPRPGINLQQIEQEFTPVEADNLKLLGKERDKKAAPADIYQLVDSESNLREGPGANYPIVRKSRKGEVGEALENKLGWIKLQFTDGSMAWVHEQNVKSKG
jgi:hypothetical protein